MARMAGAGELPLVQVDEHMSRRVLAEEKLMLVEVRLAPGAQVDSHSHPHEQAGYVLSGRVLFGIGGKERELGPGSMYSVEGGVSHRARVIGEEAATLVEVFTPIREDFLA